MLRSKINWKTTTGQKFHRGQNFRLTPVTSLNLRNQVLQFTELRHLQATLGLRF